MTSVCAASSIPYAVVSAGAVAIADPTAPAMKRRRENNHGGVAIISELIPKMEHQMPRLVMSAPLVAAQPIVTVRKSQGAKRPQMKYDPSVPMTKEETSAWRREQRRKRNRESAAACRKRQRDRISELEIEVNGWKDQFEGALNKLKGIEGTAAGEELRGQLEAMFAIAPSKMEVEGAPTSSSTAQTQQRCSTPPNVPEAITSMIIPVHQGVPFTVPSHHVVSPHDRPKFIPPVTSSMEQQVILEDISFPILEADPIIKANDFLGGIITPTNNSNIASRVETRQHLNEKITRPAKSRLLTFSRVGRRRSFVSDIGLMTQ